MKRRRGIVGECFTSSSVADDVLVKACIADTARRGRTLMKADVPDAYSKGKRLNRGVTYMELPEAFKDMRDDEGNRRPIAFYGRVCTPSESRFSVSELELLACTSLSEAI